MTSARTLSARALANVQGASVPYPYGGKPRVIMVDLDMHALQANGLSPAEVSDAITAQNVIAPSGDVKMGNKDYTVGLNNSPDLIQAINDFPIKHIGNATVFLENVAYVHDGYQVQTNAVAENGRAGRADDGPQDRRGLHACRSSTACRRPCPTSERWSPGIARQADLRPVDFRARQPQRRVARGGIAAGLTGLMILLFLGLVAQHAHHLHLDPALDPHRPDGACGRWARRSTS